MLLQQGTGVALTGKCAYPTFENGHLPVPVRRRSSAAAEIPGRRRFTSLKERRFIHLGTFPVPLAELSRVIVQCGPRNDASNLL